MGECLPRNCHICSCYAYEEIGDSDFGAVYAEEKTCLKDKDMNMETEEYIQGFDYTVERECCSPDFWLVVDSDSEVRELFNEEADCMSDDLYKTEAYLKFKEKYQCK